MSSMEMPLTTREPRNGGLNTWLSASTAGDRGGIRSASSPRSRPAGCGPAASRPNSGSSTPERFISISWSMVWRPSKASLP